MSDAFYDIIRFLGRPAFWTSSSPVVRGREHVPRRGAFLLAANHQSPYDVPLIIRHTPRRVDFISIVEVFQKPLVGWFYGSMNAFPLDRSRSDPKTVRTILDRLERGRVVGIFPEGGCRRGPASVVHSRRIKPGVGRLARLANVPIVPCVVVGSEAYARFTSWLPHRRTRYGVIFGEPLPPATDEAGDGWIEAKLCDELVALHAKLTGELGFGIPAE